MPYYRHSHHPCNIDHRSKEQGHWDNKPFYSCGHNTLAFEWMWGWDGPYLNTKPPLFSYRNCAWKILVSIRTTWFSQESRESCIKTRSTPASFPSILNWETTSGSNKYWNVASKSTLHIHQLTALHSEGNIDKIQFYHSISPYRLFTVESLDLFVSISYFLGLLRSLCIRLKSPVFICLSVNIL